MTNSTATAADAFVGPTLCETPDCGPYDCDCPGCYAAMVAEHEAEVWAEAAYERANDAWASEQSYRDEAEGGFQW